MAAKGTAHTVCCRQLQQPLLIVLQQLALVQCQAPIVLLSVSEPEPDLAILDLATIDKPTVDQVFLVIEIEDTSLKYDRTVKKTLYAQRRFHIIRFLI
jgi:Uma2 family endonuclease